MIEIDDRKDDRKILSLIKVSVFRIPVFLLQDFFQSVSKPPLETSRIWKTFFEKSRRYGRALKPVVFRRMSLKDTILKKKAIEKESD